MKDVCMILEGTYPYVAGGVSTWVYDLIRELHDKTFSILYLGPHRSSYKKRKYDIPSNVVDFQESYLFDYVVEKEKLKTKSKKDDFKLIKEFLVGMRSGDTRLFEDIYHMIGDPLTRRISLYDLAHSKEGWKMIEELYAGENSAISFVDYFWTWRFLYLPFFSLLRTNIPAAQVYHCPSTGYAGVLGVLGKIKHNRPLLLTEHGIYTRERKIEVSRADWIYSDSLNDLKVTEGKDFFKDWWVNLFAFFSKLTYQYTDEIITLYEGNRKIQIEEGAEPNKTKVIPNGVDADIYLSLKPDKQKKKIVGFAGRVVPIKDVKSFITACRKIHEEIGEVEFYVMGPTEEDEEYYHECVLMAQMENLEGVMHFMGKVNLKEYYPKLDVLVLTSISEGQPIVILEANACGVPVVSTDVGSCSELLYGSRMDDQLMGASGIITPICNSEATADAVIKILRDPELQKKMGEVGKQRVSAYYQLDDLIANYQMLYSTYAQEIRWQV